MPSESLTRKSEKVRENEEESVRKLVRKGKEV
jgi:hypothetical protein